MLGHVRPRSGPAPGRCAALRWVPPGLRPPAWRRSPLARSSLPGLACRPGPRPSLRGVVPSRRRPLRRSAPRLRAPFAARLARVGPGVLLRPWASPGSLPGRPAGLCGLAVPPFGPGGSLPSRPLRAAPLGGLCGRPRSSRPAGLRPWRAAFSAPPRRAWGAATATQPLVDTENCQNLEDMISYGCSLCG